MMTIIKYTISVWKEGNMYVGHVPEFDVASCGLTKTQAQLNAQEALELFLEGAADMGTLDEIVKTIPT